MRRPARLRRQDRSALSVESWSDLPITNVVFRNASIEFDGGGKAEQARQAVKGPGVDARSLPAWGLYARNVENLSLQDVRFNLSRPDQRPAVFTDQVANFQTDNFHYPTNAPSR